MPTECVSVLTGSDFVLRGNIYKELQMIDKAMADYDEAIMVGLEGLVPNIGRVGNFLDKHGKHEKAIVFYNHGVQTQNTSPAVSRIYADRGASWARLKQYDKALADFTSSIEFNAWDCEHHLSRMRPPMLRESPADFQAAFLKLADRAIEITDGNGQSYITRSLVLLTLGQRDNAKKDLARGVELDPNSTSEITCGRCCGRYKTKPALSPVRMSDYVEIGNLCQDWQIETWSHAKSFPRKWTARYYAYATARCK